MLLIFFLQHVCFHLLQFKIFIVFFSFHFEQGYVFEEENGKCAAFLINNDKGNTVTVQFNNSSYKLLPKSISILPDCQNVAFNTAHVSYNFVRINYMCTELINLVILCSILVLLNICNLNLCIHYTVKYNEQQKDHNFKTKLQLS